MCPRPLWVHVGLLEGLEAGIRLKVREAASPICLKLLGDKREKEGLSPLKVQRFQRGAPPAPQHHQGQKLRHMSDTGVSGGDSSWTLTLGGRCPCQGRVFMALFVRHRLRALWERGDLFWVELRTREGRLPCACLGLSPQGLLILRQSLCGMDPLQKHHVLLINRLPLYSLQNAAVMQRQVPTAHSPAARTS